MSTTSNVSSSTSSSEASTTASKSSNPLFYTIVHERNIGSVRKLLDVSLPVAYGNDWYNDVLKTPHEFTKMAFYNDVFAGVICSKVEVGENNSSRLYIMALAVLAAYRGHGIGTSLVKTVLDTVRSSHPEIKEIYLHVWTSNNDAVRFYEKLGFTITETLTNYYRRIDPPDAYILRLPINQ